MSTAGHSGTGQGSGATPDLRRTPRTSARPPAGAPGGRTIGLWLVGAVVAGLATGAVAHLTRGPAARTVASAAEVSTDATPAAASPTAAASATPSRSSSPSPSMPLPAPDRWVAEPWATSGLELSSLKSAKRADDGSVVITVDRLTYYSGAQATAYYDEHPELERGDVAIVNQNPRIYTFTLVPNSPIFLGPLIGLTDPPQRSDGAHLLDGLARRPTEGGEVFVWLRHNGKDRGWATYLAEQFFP